MREEGKYLYGIIGTSEERNFGPIGIGSREVETIACRDLSAVVSNAPMGRYVLSKENLLAIGDKMLLNAAFLVDRNREKEFDDLVERLDLRYRERIKFAYVGPVPPYNFVHLALHPEE